MDLYSEIILDYFKHPRNKGELANPTTEAEEYNPLCGDKIKISLKIQDDKVEKATYDGQGCAISQAAASMLTEKLIGKTLQEVKALPNEEIYEMLGVEISAARAKCALLSLVTAKKAAIICKNQKK